jgi:general secretion pathway protein E
MRYPLPYAFARTHQLLLEEDAGNLTLLVHPESAPGAVGEVLRKYPQSQLQTQAANALIQRISAAYAQGESSAAAVVSEVESDADLSRMMQELPAIHHRRQTS